MKPATTTRNPHGVTKSKTIALRLIGKERVEAEEVSEDRHQSLSAMAREAYLLGLPLLKQQPVSKSA